MVRAPSLLVKSTHSKKSEFLSPAVALLDPIDWLKAFGLVMIEAVTCGTPIIAFNRGSAREIVDGGLTDITVDNEEGAIGALDRVSRLSAGKIHERSEQCFTTRRMGIENVYADCSLVRGDVHRLKMVSDRHRARFHDR